MAFWLSIDRPDSRMIGKLDETQSVNCHFEGRSDEKSIPTVAAVAKNYSNTTVRFPCKKTRSSNTNFTARASTIFSTSRPACTIATAV